QQVPVDMVNGEPPPRSIAGASKTQRLARRGGPALELRTVSDEKGQGQPVETERHARRVDRGAASAAQVPGRTEMIQMVVEADARRRALVRIDGDLQLVLQRLLDLAHGQQLAGAAEEWVARLVQAMVEAQQVCQLRAAREPLGAKAARLFARTDA